MEVDSSSRWMKPPVENDTESLDLNSDNDRDESKENSDNEKNNKISKRSTHTKIENVKKMKKEKKNGMKPNTKSDGGTPKSDDKLKQEATVNNPIYPPKFCQKVYIFVSPDFKYLLVCIC